MLYMPYRSGISDKCGEFFSIAGPSLGPSMGPSDPQLPGDALIHVLRDRLLSPRAAPRFGRGEEMIKNVKLYFQFKC